MSKKHLAQALRSNLLRRKQVSEMKNYDIQKKEKIYEGKAKILYATNDSNLLIQYFKDDTTAFNNLKKEVIKKKGILNNSISEHLMLEVSKQKIPTHFVKKLNEREQLIKKVKIIPLEIIMRNIAAGSMAKRLNIAEGKKLANVIFEICYKNDALGDPLINDDHAVLALEIVSKNHLEEIKNYAIKINKILQKIFADIGISLVDFKIEFGLDEKGQVILADEISPDSCRLWDIKTAKKLDKDVFRRDLGNLVDAYEEVAQRLGIAIS